MTKLCECGCGNPAPIAKKTDKSTNRIKGHPMRFVVGHGHKGARNTLWKGGVKNNGQYILVLMPDHPRAEPAGYVLQHILIAEKALGKPLPKGVEVHHMNNNGRDNSNNNLVICPDRAYHMLLHKRMRALRASGNPNWRKCTVCKQWDDPMNFNKWKQDRFVHPFCKQKRKSEAPDSWAPEALAQEKIPF